MSYILALHLSLDAIVSGMKQACARTTERQGLVFHIYTETRRGALSILSSSKAFARILAEVASFFYVKGPDKRFHARYIEL